MFNNKTLRWILLKLRLPIGIIFVVLLATQIKPEFFLAGLIVSLFGELLQLWCFATLSTKKVLAARGLFSLARNPMYISRYVFILGCFILTGNIWLILVYSVIYYFYMVNRVKREEILLKEIFGNPYEEYCSTVDRFIPTFKYFNLKNLLYFEWKLFFQNHGHWNLLGAVLCYIFFYYFTFMR